MELLPLVTVLLLAHVATYLAWQAMAWHRHAHCYLLGYACHKPSIDPALRGRAKTEMHCLVSAHIGAHDNVHATAVHRENAGGRLGVSLSKALPKAAIRTFTENLQRLAPRILPAGELARFAVRLLLRKLLRE